MNRTLSELEDRLDVSINIIVLRNKKKILILVCFFFISVNYVCTLRSEFQKQETHGSYR